MIRLEKHRALCGAARVTDVYRQLETIFGTRSQEFSSEGDAIVFRNEQSSRWTELISSLIPSTAPSSIGPLEEQVGLGLHSFYAVVQSHESAWFLKKVSHNGLFSVTGSLPLLPHDMNSIFSVVRDARMQATGAILQEVGLTLVDALTIKDDAAMKLFLLYPISKYATEYEIYKALNSNRFRQEMQAATSSVSSAEARCKDITNAAQIQSNNQSSTWTEFLDSCKKEHNAALESMVESETLKGATETWTNKVRLHRWVFFVGLAALVIFVAYGVHWLFNHPDDLKLFFNSVRTKNDDIPYGVVLFILVPVVAIGWLLRIVAKWVVSAMVLGADAQHRVALLETYFRLVADPKNSMGATERGIVLAAVFRSLPGQDSSEDVQPPTLLELIKGQK